MKPVLDGRTWIGTGGADGTSFRVELHESRRHRGYYYYAIYCFADEFSEETKRPALAATAEEFLDPYLSRHGLVVDDLTWREASEAELTLLLFILTDNKEPRE